jgi:hypothetical protein
LIIWINNVVQEVWEDIGKDSVSVINLEPMKREYELPKGIDFGGITMVVVNGAEYTGKWRLQSSGEQTYFKVKEGVMGLHPMSSGQGEMRIFHIRRPAEIKVAGDEVEVRSQLIEVVKNGVFCILAKAMGDAPLAEKYCSLPTRATPKDNSILASGREGESEMEDCLVSVYDLVVYLAGVLPALGVLMLWVPKGRNWIIRPAMEMVKENRKGILRQEILLLIHMRPEKVEAIEQAYDEYVKMGGNSYITRVINEWRMVRGSGVAGS